MKHEQVYPRCPVCQKAVYPTWSAAQRALDDMTVDHYYFATFTDDNSSSTLDTEPRYRRRYTILRGPYSTAEDAWGDGMDDTDWAAACVMRWTGADHTGVCYAPFTDEFDNTFPSEIDHDALFETIQAANAKGEDA